MPDIPYYRARYGVTPEVADAAREALEQSGCAIEQNGYFYYCEFEERRAVRRGDFLGAQMWRRAHRLGIEVCKRNLCVIDDGVALYDFKMNTIPDMALHERIREATPVTPVK